MSKAWGKIGDWAAEAERAEAEEAAAAAAAAAAPPQSFPSLKESVISKKGKKKTKMTLQEFTMAGGVAGGISGGGSRRELAFEHNRLTPEEMMQLPTGPKERSAEEMQYGRIGGGFSSYGGGRSGGGPRGRDRDADGDGSWGNNRRSYGGFDDERRTPVSRNSEYDNYQPSRADEVDNWAMTKKTPSFDSSSRPNRYSSSSSSLGGVSTGGGGGFSRADEIDNWAVNKKPVAVAPPPVRSSNFGSGFRDSGGPEQDRWSRGVSQERAPGVTERRRLVLDPPKGDTGPVENVTRGNKPNPFGSARPREEILAEKGLDWKKADLELEAKRMSSRPTSSHSNSRPGSAQSGSSVEVSGALQGEKPRAKVNPFGDAKPREVLLQEKGLDYRKIDLELERRRLGRPDTEEEKNLKEEIHNLKMGFEKESTENQTNLHNTILEKERELEQLSRDLDDKLRFSQKTIERPGSGAGRVGSGFQERPGSGSGRVGSGFQERPGSGSGRVGSGFQERPGSGSGRAGLGFQERSLSQSGSFDESRSVDFSERPRSRGDFGMRRGDDRRGYGGGADNRGFLGNRDVGRSDSRDRW
ncbi:putative plant specific eukaryotic initiation factor 4B [Helianthus annuus]|uniref:Plant specific eukaryotic initiation factor 4B n=1 Tax=Helianthus annuus TaxID=4232 RepID=A0A251T2F5_HELAN|nr:eukaryotic translation initiation factor 4B2 [Helianthus annuus]KAF5778193.1 putative plant specific eukaryotic initiation factor 4B [Helianthus annuus]KAJ0489620.1 putative plant specific eukaryotic initiation factor 4B [Helianthus annuus]KAJ0505534.1 putative plant specific eukaryotic initiation factor 4B [Helianthus annuus]KAJ0675201.1 putative plant specific eukaryotic initiation factor 4B [Helianthus annuus]KAJ0862957.1 putative plant specific eukaryotic initiation factor 4B [Helianthu